MIDNFEKHHIKIWIDLNAKLIEKYFSIHHKFRIVAKLKKNSNKDSQAFKEYLNHFEELNSICNL